jgi:restriction endonuclease-like protein
MNRGEEGPDIHLLMAGQHGAAATTQVRRSLRWNQQRALVEARVWRHDGPRVVTSRSAPTTWQQRVMVACLATRGVASHGTAARLHRLDGFARMDEVHITLRYHQHRHRHDGAVVHVSRVIDESDQLPIEGIPSVILPVCLLQLAEQSNDDMIRALDGSLRDGISPTWIRQVATRYDRRGRSAPRQLLMALDERVNATLPRSWFQRLAARLLAEAGLETVDEYPIYEGRRLLAQLDLAIPEMRIGIECQSWQWHASPAAQRHDAIRKRALRRLGWEIIDVWWSDLDRIDDVLATIRVVIAEHRRALM